MTELSSFNYDLTRVVHGPGGINEMAHVKFGEVCAHGQLRRSCEVCERDVTIEDLRRQLDCLRFSMLADVTTIATTVTGMGAHGCTAQ